MVDREPEFAILSPQVGALMNALFRSLPEPGLPVPPCRTGGPATFPRPACGLSISPPNAPTCHEGAAASESPTSLVLARWGGAGAPARPDQGRAAGAKSFPGAHGGPDQGLGRK